ncbi:nucleotidyltransferase domain-containing protein [Thermococcus gammatolerans]|uniref:Nucleotidyltransferase, putative n=1 Tax=Thermococcus gammatolerans (strain DSM 15229 / JCM 11827 / EJ3) TaxID=593117 RepID=C5A3R0_THEGJ|nr:nucleotidyltransferase domain-containing protein [Thermococcus gammatolerans]ACS32872.1 Nucleotidyltransferase, putative [Thermococcus gammatolerans EJ3]
MRVKPLAECIRKRIGRVTGLHSLILYGSLVRGDFLPRTSDVDFFAVLEDETDPELVLEKITPVLKECSSYLNPVEVDIAWEWLSNLRDPLNSGYPYKFLTVYQRDFREHHIVLLGEDVIDLLPEYPLEEIISRRLEDTLKNLKRFKGNRKMLHILAGEAARLVAFLNGSTLLKGDVLHTLQELGEGDAVKIYRAYIDGRKLEFEEAFLESFIKRWIKKLKGKSLPSLSSPPLKEYDPIK